MTPTPRTRLGLRGESIARGYLEARHFAHLASNWRCPSGELDLVMRQGEELVFVEVKTRRGEGAGRAEEGVSPRQARRILAACAWFLAERPDLAELVWRVDLVALTLDSFGNVARISHWENALTAE